MENMMNLTLFEIDSGPTWWVAATDATQAHELWVQSMIDEGLEGKEIEETVMERSISEILHRSRALTLKGDGDPDRDMWEVLEEMEESGVVACSEWP